VRVMHGVWASCLSLAAWGLVVRVLLSGHVSAWVVLPAQLAACGLAYVATMWLLDRGPLLLAWQMTARLRARTAA
jgi:hypothetical protein